MKPKKKSEKKPEKLVIPSIEALVEFVETLRIQDEIKVHNRRNVKRRIQHKKFLELEEKEVEKTAPMKKVWRKKVSSPTATPAGPIPILDGWSLLHRKLPIVQEIYSNATATVEHDKEKTCWRRTSTRWHSTRPFGPIQEGQPPFTAAVPSAPTGGTLT
ncbi:hypothetical protein C2845_PM15G01450 [Panicum miliaceum]|uniref:Uncharacterized protein n=1 Tax=Panicum miliaceum TaxID=4540 RepID=A0A3L6QEL0_PANMI|nr:hypothetical protein C2845_PM15G01450 [Panicum miliaceum]